MSDPRTRWGRETRADAGEYDAQWDRMAARGIDPHGEVAFVMAYEPTSVLDAGCGTGRVAIELARHAITTVGVDADASMIAEARRRAPDLEWEHADLVGLELGRTFSVVVLAGNVPLFTAPGTQHALITSCAQHVAPDGLLVAGFQLGRGYSLAEFDASCGTAGLAIVNRWSTWDRQPFSTPGDYAVSVASASTAASA